MSATAVTLATKLPSAGALALAALAAAVVIGALVVLMRRHGDALPMLAVLALPFRVPISTGGRTVNLLVPLYLVVAAGVIAHLLPAVLEARRTGGFGLRRPRRELAFWGTPAGMTWLLAGSVQDFSRDDVDAYAARSQERAAAAQSEGRFAKSVIPVRDLNEHVVLDRDEFIRPGTTVQALAGLKPSFAAMGEMGGFDAVALQKYHWIEKINHVHTPGNSSGIVDGASLVVVGNEKTGSELGLRARAKILATAVSGADPTIMLTGPAPASRKALAKAGLTVDDIDLVEINEAFAAVVLRFVRDMGLDMDRVNVNGGAIAMGHPLGATGGMILGTLVDELERQNKRYGLATLCIGGGMGIATVVERV